MGIKVNMTDKEASSAPRELLPVGKYKVAVTDGELKQSKSAKNNGKPFYALELTVNEGDYDGRKIWTNVMMFEGALYSVVQMLKALGVEFTSGGNFQVPGHEENELPELEWFIGQEFVVSVVKTEAKKDKETGKEYPERNDIKSWMSAKNFTGSPKAATKSNGGNSLLPV